MKYSSLILFFLFINNLHSQVFENKKINYNNLKGEKILLKNKGINLEAIFIGNIDTIKPLIIFIPGSQPVPLFFTKKETENELYSMFPPEIISKRKDFNYLLLSKPGIKSIAKINELDQNYFILDSITHKPPLEYTTYNNLEFYTEAFNILIDYLTIKKNTTNIIVIGHSQGSRIATDVSKNIKVNKLVYMSSDPLGRMSFIYDVEYSKFKSRNDEKLEYYEKLMNKDYSDSMFYGETYKSWKSFSNPAIGTLVNLNKQILIVYGDMDENCPNCYIFSFLPDFYTNITTLKYMMTLIP